MAASILALGLSGSKPISLSKITREERCIRQRIHLLHWITLPTAISIGQHRRGNAIPTIFEELGLDIEAEQEELDCGVVRS